MFGWLRLSLILFVLLTIIYWLVSWYSRSVRREKLNQRFDRGNIPGSREEYVRRGLKEYDGSLRRKLILGVYVIPVVIVIVLIYVVNFM